MVSDVGRHIMDIKIILLAVGIIVWIISVNVSTNKPKLGRNLQAIATWIFLITIAWKIFEIVTK